MNYLIAVVGDRIQAEAAYTALETAKIPQDNRAILGKGYRTLEDVGLITPKEKARQQAGWMARWLVPFGLLGGIAFNLSTQLNTFPWAGEVGNVLLGGLLGAFGGAMGSLFIGGGAGLAIGGGSDPLPDRQKLKQGKFLIVVKGSEAVIRRATPVLEKCKPEGIQSCSDRSGSLFLS